MKKLLLSAILLLSLLTMTSCTVSVNWFGGVYDVEWYYVAIPVILVLLVAYLTIMTKSYICPKCKTVFRPRWYQVSAGIHFMNKRLLRCPVCRRKGFCKRKKKGRSKY